VFYLGIDSDSLPDSGVRVLTANGAVNTKVMRNTILHVMVSTGFLSRNQEIRSFQVPNFQVHPINEGYSPDLPRSRVRGLLGMDFLRLFPKWSWKLDRNELWLDT